MQERSGFFAMALKGVLSNPGGSEFFTILRIHLNIQIPEHNKRNGLKYFLSDDLNWASSFQFARSAVRLN